MLKKLETNRRKVFVLSIAIGLRPPTGAYRAVGHEGARVPKALGGGALGGAPPLGGLLILLYFLFKIFLKSTKFFEFSKNFSN